ncbi:MAG: hypothetical protein IBX70_12325 [Clostridia bacterium]|nr:hypothetical protein [Clostridia bacterium]
MIKKFFKEENGDMGVDTILIVTFIIVFIIIPLASYGFDFLRIQVIAGEVSSAVDAAIADSYHSLDMELLSKEDFRSDNGLFQYYIEENLKKALNLDSALLPNDKSILDGPFTIDSFNFYDSSYLPYTDLETGKIYERPFIEISFTIRVKPLLYQEMILAAIGKPYKEFSATRKASLPINN